MTNNRVLVTGATGYIASHIIKLLLEKGYKVRGTVRYLNTDIVTAFLNLWPEKSSNLDLVEAYLEGSSCWERAVSGCDYVIHVASPVPIQSPLNEDDVIRPAVEGTLSILKACEIDGSVKRVVLTSSTAAVSNGKDTDVKKLTEDNWCDITPSFVTAYYKSKLLAEKAAWKFMKRLPGARRFELTVLNPGYTIGPLLLKKINMSVIMPMEILKGNMPLLPRFRFPVADVRDVAEVHLQALTIPEAAGERFLVTGSSIWLKELSDMIADEFKPHGYSISGHVAPYWIFWLLSWFVEAVRSTLFLIGTDVQCDNSKMMKVFNIKPRDAKDSICDMCYSMIDLGLVEKTANFKGPK